MTLPNSFDSKTDFLRCLAIYHPEILTFVITSEKELESCRLKYQTYVKGWEEIFKHFNIRYKENVSEITNSKGIKETGISPEHEARNNSEEYIPETPEEAGIPPCLMYGNTDHDVDFLFRIKNYINWESFSLNGEFRWDEISIGKFSNEINWGINSEEKEREFNNEYRLIGSALDSQGDILLIKEEFRYKKGGISASPFLEISVKLLKKYEDKWDYYALCKNHSIEWDAESFEYLITNRIGNRRSKHYEELKAWDEDIFKYNSNYFGNSFLLICNSRKDCFLISVLFDLFKNTIVSTYYGSDESLTKEIKLYSLFITIAQSLPLEKDRLECLYSYELVDKIYKRSYKINLSFEPIIPLIVDRIMSLTEIELDCIMNSINPDHLETIKSMFNQNASRIRSDFENKGRGGLIVDDEWLLGGDDSYCPICQQSPCMCSDPDHD